jgi:hypothetical protein
MRKRFFFTINGSKNVYMKEITLFQQVYLYILKYLLFLLLILQGRITNFSKFK